MPPPPPSPSYLWSPNDSDIDSEAEEVATDADAAAARLSDSENEESVAAAAAGATKLENEACNESSKLKKKRKKRKKKKKKSKETKSVSFANIWTRSFVRSFYSDGVPSDGGWPLGFSSEHSFEDSEEPVSVEDYEIDKQARLEERWYRICPDGEEIPQEPLETRQWDYKFGKKNPLFRALPEKARMHRIMGTEEAPPSPPKKAATSPTVGRRTRANSDLGNRPRNSASRSRSSSFSTRSNSYSDDKDIDFEARHIMQELEQLRTWRSKRGSKGCTCRKLHVYIPPPGSGKKAAHRRMKVSKLKEELRARSALPSPEGSRENMEQLLLKLVEQEPCCGPSCECVQNGIECQSDACTCWHAAAHHVKDGTAPLRPSQIEERCGNSFGMVTVDSDMIDAYRAPFLTCLPVDMSSEASVDEEKKTEVGG